MSRVGLAVGRVMVAGLAGCLLAGALGCHSAYIEATVKNDTSQPIAPVEVDYPSASFGRTLLAAGAEYHYRFKVLGSGPTKVLWTNAAHKDMSGNGPVLHEGDEGKLTVVIGGENASWNLALTPH